MDNPAAVAAVPCHPVNMRYRDAVEMLVTFANPRREGKKLDMRKVELGETEGKVSGRNVGMPSTQLRARYLVVLSTSLSSLCTTGCINIVQTP